MSGNQKWRQWEVHLDQAAEAVFFNKVQRLRVVREGT